MEVTFNAISRESFIGILSPLAGAEIILTKSFEVSWSQSSQQIRQLKLLARNFA